MNKILVPDVLMHHSRHRAGSPEYWAEITTEKMVRIADTAPPVIREQTIEFKGQVLALIFQGMKRAIADEVLACARLLEDGGQHEAAAVVLSRWKPPLK